MNTEERDALAVGRTLLVSYNPQYDGEYTQEGRAARAKAANQTEGRCIDYSNSHGLCYNIRFKDGTSAWFENSEVSVKPE